MLEKPDMYILFIYHIDIDNWGLKVPSLYQSQPFGQISLPQSPRQETLWALTGFESTAKTVMLPLYDFVFVYLIYVQFGIRSYILFENWRFFNLSYEFFMINRTLNNVWNKMFI